MAVKINGKKVSTGVVSKHVTLPLCGVYIAKTKANDAFTMYIDHYTGTSREHRAYKPVFIHTKDSETPFGRLCKAFKVALPSACTQQAAAELLAASMAEYGALKCVRSGKKQEWLDIHPVHMDVDALPWGFPAKDGMVLKSLWNPPEDSDDSEEDAADGYYSIVGKTISDVASEIRKMGGINTAVLSEALGRVDAMDDGVDVECHAKLSELLATAVKMGLDVIKLKNKEEEHVQA